MFPDLTKFAEMGAAIKEAIDRNTAAVEANTAARLKTTDDAYFQGQADARQERGE